MIQRWAKKYTLARYRAGATNIVELVTVRTADVRRYPKAAWLLGETLSTVKSISVWSIQLPEMMRDADPDDLRDEFVRRRLPPAQQKGGSGFTHLGHPNNLPRPRGGHRFPFAPVAGLRRHSTK